MNKFNPSDSYEGLKRQAYALHTLCDSQERSIRYYGNKDYALSESRLNKLDQSLDSERDMNAALTSENEQLKARVAELEEHVKREQQGNLNLIEFDVVPVVHHYSIMKEVERANAILDRAPTQSLNDFKAQGIAEMLMSADEDARTISTVSELVLFAESYIRQLREQGRDQ